MLEDKEPLLEDTKKPFFMKMAAEPFADDGACRLPYYARVTINEVWVPQNTIGINQLFHHRAR